MSSVLDALVEATIVVGTTSLCTTMVENTALLVDYMSSLNTTV